MNFKDFVQSFVGYNPRQKYQFNLTENENINDNNYNSKTFSNEKKVFPSINVNLQYMKTKYNISNNSDIIAREFILNARGKQYNSFLVYIDGMIDSDILNKFVLEPLMMRNKNNLFDGSQSKVVSEAVANNITVRKIKRFDLGNYILNSLMPQNSVEEQNEFEKIISGINSRKLCFIC